jgi:hypothetical protein
MPAVALAFERRRSVGFFAGFSSDIGVNRLET